MAKSIPPRLETEVLVKAGLGWSTRQIVSWLSEEHRVMASQSAVVRMLGRTKTERQETAQAVVREKLAGCVASDLDKLAELQAGLMGVARKLIDIADANPYATIGASDTGAGGKPVADVACNAVKTVQSLTEKKLELSGANQPNSDVLDPTSDEYKQFLRETWGFDRAGTNEPEDEADKDEADKDEPSDGVAAK